MKLPALLVVGSLAANAVLFAALALKPALAPPEYQSFFQQLGVARREATALPVPRGVKPVQAKADRAKYWSRLASDDLATLITNLRAAGFSPLMIRAIIGAQIEARFRDRMNALVGTVADAPYWKPEPTSSLNNPKFFEELNQIYRDRSRMLRQLLGDELLASAGGDATAAQRRQFGDIPKAKIDLVQRVVDDYADMLSQVRAATQGITLPEDREKMALLEREKHNDLAAILTPQELESYEMRNSNVTSRLRQALTIMDATEDEFRAIFRAQQGVADLLYPTGGVIGADMSRLRQEAQAKVNQDIKAALGEQRFADYQRSTDYEYQQLVRIAQRENIPTETVNRTYGIRDTVVQESGRIYDDKVMTPDEKRAALLAVGQKAKAQVLSLLGLNAGQAFIQTASWISAPERGWVIRPSANGQGNTYYSLPTSTPPPRN
jgi:hypothetical protein